MSIRNLETLTDDKGCLHTIRFKFGPHHFIEVTDQNGVETIAIGATHHGIRADASTVGSELEEFIGELRQAHPERAID